MNSSPTLNRLRAYPAFESGCLIGESPVWDPVEERLYWIDIRGRAMFEAAEGLAPRRHDLPLTVSAVARSAEGGFIAATERGFARIRWEGGELRLHPVSEGPVLVPGTRLNDGACDRQGRFWSGEIHPWPNTDLVPGRLLRLDPSGRAEAFPGDLLIQNGLAWSPDGTRMYISDSHPRRPRILSFAYETETGLMGKGRELIAGGDLPGRPDGAAMDVDGCYWSAALDAGLVLRITPAGRIDTVVEVPHPAPTNICFGGADLRTMFITTLERDGHPGHVYTLTSGHQGVGEVSFGSAA